MITSPTTRKALTALAGLTLVLSACSSSPEEPPVDRSVHSSGETLAAAEIEDLSLPFAFQELPTFTLPYDSAPVSLDGVLFGLQETNRVLQFTAVNTQGEELWSVQRPATCSGFTLTISDGSPVAVLTDVESTEDSLAQVTARAYDLHTGEPVWGPTSVSGPWHGPGTVFASPAPASAMGEVSDVQVLDPATGTLLDPGEQVVGEYHGTVLLRDTDGGQPILRAEGEHEWSIPISDLGAADPSNTVVGNLPGVDAPFGYALITLDRAEHASVLRLSDGQVLTAEATSAAWDPAAQMLVTTEAGTLAGYTEDGPAWNRGLEGDMRIVASGGVLTYLRSDSAVQVANAVTGDHAVGYSPDATSYAVPTLITDDGAAAFKFDRYTLVGTHVGP